jgi:sugar phosphate isomerase/epimerase
MTIILGCTTRPYSDIPVSDACARIAAAGYTDMALFGAAIGADSSRDHVLSIRRAVLDSGLSPSMLLGRVDLQNGPGAALSAYRRLIDNAALLGATWLLELGLDQETLFGTYLDVIRQAAFHAEQAGIGITLKPHGGITLTSQGLIDVHRRVNQPAFSICYDPGNIIYYSKGQEMPTDHLAEVAPLVRTGIIKDCVVRDGSPDVMVTPGEGMVDWRSVLSTLLASGFVGPLYVECVAGDSIEQRDRNVKRTLAFVRGVLSELGQR